MAKCAGCSGGLASVSHSNTNCIHLTGLGTADSPLVATLQIDPASPSAITCGVGGLSVAGGGGGGAGQNLFFTVATPGVVAFGGLGGTPPAALSTADFVGNGVNDSVAIQAGIDAIAALAATAQGIVLYILPGLYLTNNTLRPKGVLIRGQHKSIVQLIMSTGFGAPANARLFDGSISGLNYLNIEGVTAGNQTGGAAVVVANQLYAQHSTFQGDGPGADTAMIVCQDIVDYSVNFGKFVDNVVSSLNPADHMLIMGGLMGGPASLGNFIIAENNIQGIVTLRTGSGFQTLFIRDNIFSGDLTIQSASTSKTWMIHNNQITGSLILSSQVDTQVYNSTINGNVITNGNIRITNMIVSNIGDNFISAIIFGVGMVFDTCGENIIQSNFIDGASGHGMTLVDSHNNGITGNRIRSYSGDGINITTSDDNVVQVNNIDSGVGVSGINVVSGLANFVTNNDLRGSGATPFVDTGTSTETTAGNRLA